MDQNTIKWDSVDKIVKYFQAVTTRPFIYKDHTYTPKTLVVRSNLINHDICKPRCAGCCRAFTLDLLPDEYKEQVHKNHQLRHIEINGVRLPIMSDIQSDVKELFCRNADIDAGCRIHSFRPFSCDFEMMRVIARKDSNILTTQIFSRHWNMKRIDGGVGSYCEIHPPTRDSETKAVMRLLRLKQWTDYFQIETIIPQVIHAINEGFLRKVEKIKLNLEANEWKAIKKIWD